MPSLYENGWRQGSVFKAEMVVTGYDYSNGVPSRLDETYARWSVISQDCDLAAADSNVNDLLIEVLPVLHGTGGASWGIRSRLLRLADGLHTDSRLPKLRISPSAISVYIDSMTQIAPERAVALKTWLGRRYDRPAVPEMLVGLARAIAAAVKETRTPELSEITHDVLFAATEEVPASFELIAVITDASGEDQIREWMAQAALKVDPALGSLSRAPDAITKDQLSVADLENTYSADLSDISWVKGGPRGAV